jgi:hypothetical protein
MPRTCLGGFLPEVPNRLSIRDGVAVADERLQRLQGRLSSKHAATGPEGGAKPFRTAAINRHKTKLGESIASHQSR